MPENTAMPIDLRAAAPAPDAVTSGTTILLIALSSKNAILIVEYARERRIAGMAITEAALGHQRHHAEDEGERGHQDRAEAHPRRLEGGLRDRHAGPSPCCWRCRWRCSAPPGRCSGCTSPTTSTRRSA
jgi:hypothetical protein